MPINVFRVPEISSGDLVTLVFYACVKSHTAFGGAFVSRAMSPNEITGTLMLYKYMTNYRPS